ncbi:MAG: peptide ABC transporter ATP-binding protein [Candidatus Omnitrophica bacterium CG22_combo_CG10-13_8_21_14_all_43_16]|nr:MAG: peptide ABC transporter ATP-binding protein [Candidatus Omnitrophica bacterium CG22_combo_CG10-13_8_21_14_all_43_16]
MLLQIKNLKINYKSDNRMVEVVRGVDLDIDRGECVGLIGESGCGKTTAGLSITKLIPERKGNISSGEILFASNDILKLNPEELRNIRGKKISYVFQEPFSSLNPVFTIYEQIRESLEEKDNPGRRIAEILKSVGLEKIIGRKNAYPHELSGGMQQRAMIGMAIASRPDLLVLDEPTTALDVTVQRQILDLIMELKNKMNLAILFISHDLRIVFNIADKIAIMYAGKIIEFGPKEKIVSSPAHPYTIGLIDSIPSLEHRKKPFNAISGKAPLFSELPQGCKFYPRCRFRIDKCTEKEPELRDVSGGQASRCIRIEELKSNGTIKNR